MMTKSDFTLIARVVNRHVGDLTAEFIGDLTSTLRENNPNFDTDKFLEACCAKRKRVTKIIPLRPGQEQRP